jgi:predicted small lipoprotein YifL
MLRVIAGVMGFALVALSLAGCGDKKPLIDPAAVGRVEAAANKAEAAATRAEAAAKSAADAAAKAEAAAAKAQSMFDKGLRK